MNFTTKEPRAPAGFYRKPLIAPRNDGGLTHHDLLRLHKHQIRGTWAARGFNAFMIAVLVICVASAVVIIGYGAFWQLFFELGEYDG